MSPTITLPDLARRHCAAHKPSLTLDGFIPGAYGLSSRALRNVTSGKNSPSAKLLRGLSQAHARLFPGEPILLLLPHGHPPVLLGQIPQS